MTTRFGCFWLLSFAALPFACSGSGQCLRHSDCTRDESCQLGTCVIKSTPGSSGGDASGGHANGFGGRSSFGGGAMIGGSAGEAGLGGAGGEGG